MAPRELVQSPSNTRRVEQAMNDMSQLASAMLVLVFAAVMLVVGQLYIENRSAKTLIIRAAQASPTR
jgi:hypothetical protein